MSARNYYSNDELVKDAVYWREREAKHRERQALRMANTASRRAQASENILQLRIEEQLRRVRGETKRSYR